MGENDQKFILLHDRVGDNIERSILSLGLSTKSVPLQVLRGEILVAVPEENQPYDSHKIALTGVERKSIRLECPTSEIARVSHEEADLLLGISSAIERYEIYLERNRLEAGKKIKEATKVYVKVKGLPKDVPGVVWYKGPLPTASGTMFGVELTDHKGQGTSDGTFRNHRYFTCPNDSGVFVSLDKLTLREDVLKEQKKLPCSSSSSSSSSKIKFMFLNAIGARGEKNGKKLDQKELLENYEAHLNTRVVTFIDEMPARGVLRVIGTSSHGIAMGGIELDKRLGTGTGIYQGKQLFYCKKDHAKFVPLETVLNEKDFDAISYHEDNEQCRGERFVQDEATSKSLVYDNSRTKGSSKSLRLRRSNSTSSTASTVSAASPGTDEALKIAGVESGTKDIFLKEQEKILAEIQSINSGRKRESPDHGFDDEKVDSSSVNLSFKEEHFQHNPSKTLRFSPCKTPLLSHPAHSELCETTDSHPSHNSIDAQRITLAGAAVGLESEGYSSVLCRGSSSPTSSSSTASQDIIINPRSCSSKDMAVNLSMVDARGQDVVADCDFDTAKRPVETIIDETAEKMRESQDQLQTINMDTSGTPVESSVVVGDFAGVESGMASSQAVDQASRFGLEVGSMAEIPLSDGKSTRYGVIRWIGRLPELNSKLVAGLELEEEQSACSDGTFGGRRYFTCPAGRGFFVLLQHCRRDSRFCAESPDATLNSGKAFGSYDSPAVSGIVAPPATMHDNGYGRMRGIQGHHNSCYLDATLFSMFFFTTVFDSLLHRQRNDQDLEEYEQVQTVLKDNIVNPLRRYGFVRADRVLELRKLLDKLGSVTGLVNEEKDPEEFLNTLLQQVFKAEPFLHLKYNNRCEGAHFYQVIPEKEEGIEVPTVQSLLEQSFLAADIKLTEVPSCLILQMPRFGSKYKMYEHILLSPVLDVTHVVESVPHECVACGTNVAAFECKDCSRHKLFSNYNRIISLCKKCNELLHFHKLRRDHKPTPIVIPREYSSFVREENSPIQRQEMELFAVVCIQTSHYVAFVKCGSGPAAPWCFFDSMADRKGERNGYNIPSITACPEVGEWLSYKPERIADAKRSGEIPDLIKRLLGDSYLCMYQNQEVAMYK